MTLELLHLQIYSPPGYVAFLSSCSVSILHALTRPLTRSDPSLSIFFQWLSDLKPSSAFLVSFSPSRPFYLFFGNGTNLNARPPSLGILSPTPKVHNPSHRMLQKLLTTPRAQLTTPLVAACIIASRNCAVHEQFGPSPGALSWWKW